MLRVLSRFVRERLNSRRKRAWNQIVENDNETVRITEDGVSLVEASLTHPDRIDRPDLTLWHSGRPRKLRVDCVSYDADLSVDWVADLRETEPVLRRTADLLCWASLDAAARERRPMPTWRYVFDPENTSLDLPTLIALQAAAEKYSEN